MNALISSVGDRFGVLAESNTNLLKVIARNTDVAVGDLFTANTPDPDFASGGSLVGWGPVLAQILKLDFDVVAPSTGPMATRADLEAFKTKIDTLVSRAAGLVKKGALH